ncbi:hypothetical protein GH5_00451 [Leishmania sp. Ghana 2012 LV757]|uniref:hypothetical protein n=1 Tax=Leishmania sp. Ghana 2012 LV757 TaxID=2803181 RepID=UPI001B5CA738|nr:hypothetical protein GH5_00451 [Leishmania sp. Ghana 2012 LV757]
MQCITNRSYEPTSLLTDCTLAVQHLVSARSLLPPSPTADELLRLLHESGHPCTSSTPPDSSTGVLSSPPASFSAANIIRYCPTSRRVKSSFAAAGAHSMLGEMLQFFAESLTHLFTLGVADASVRAFPSEWDRRLHAPAAASLRQHHLYELQGFSTLFMHVWGQVAASRLLLRDEHGEEQDLVESTQSAAALSSPAMASTSGATARRSAAQQLPSTPPPLSASAATAHPSQPFYQKTSEGNSGNSKSGIAAAHERPCIPLTSAALFFPGAEVAPLPHGGKQRGDGPLSGLSSRSAAQPATLAVFQHALTMQAKAQRPFLPSIPREGLAPASFAREGDGSFPEASSAADRDAPRSLALVPSTSKAAPLYSTSLRPLSVEQGMQLDRQRELRRELGLRRVRNYAAEGDMRDYLSSYQENLRSVLEGEDMDATGSNLY